MLDVGCGWGSFAIHAAERLRRPRARRDPVRAPGRARPRAGRAPRGSPNSSSCASPTTASWPASGSTRSRASAWSSTWGRSGSTSTCATLHGLLRPGGRLLNHGIAKLMDFDTKDEGAFSERFVFPDGVPLPLSRIEQAMERTGLVDPARRGAAQGLRRDARLLDRELRGALRRGGRARRSRARPRLAAVPARRPPGL